MPEGMEIERKSTVSPKTDGADYLGRRVHLIGIGGAGMRALAKMLIAYGAVISGSDQAAGGALDRLSADGATICVGQRPENICDECELVVYSAAIDQRNPELLAAQQRGIEVLKYSGMLGRLMAERTGIAVAGTHGKSTTSAMVAYALSAAGADPSFIVGATVGQLGGPSGVGSGKHFVAEACEFDRSFLNLRPDYATILNIDEDHLDFYQDIADIVEAFRAFCSRVPAEGVMVANGEDRRVLDAVKSARCEVQTFGLAEGCTWRGVNPSSRRGLFEMDVMFGGQTLCHMRVPLPGLHNAYNALAAAALLYHAGVDGGQIAQLVGRFRGVARRMMLKAEAGGVTVVDDYAHHPTEIQVTLSAIRDYYGPKRLICVFQPHQHSRTRFLLKDFARSFGCADEVIVPDIYFVRDSIREKDYISSQDLVAQTRLRGTAAIYLRTFEDIVHHLQDSLADGDLVVTMGAGNIWEVADEIVRWLGRDS